MSILCSERMAPPGMLQRRYRRGKTAEMAMSEVFLEANSYVYLKSICIFLRNSLYIFSVSFFFEIPLMKAGIQIFSITVNSGKSSWNWKINPRFSFLNLAISFLFKQDSASSNAHTFLSQFMNQLSTDDTVQNNEYNENNIHNKRHVINISHIINW